MINIIVIGVLSILVVLAYRLPEIIRLYFEHKRDDS